MKYDSAETYPFGPLPQRHTVNVERAKSRAQIEMECLTQSAGRNGELWLLHRQIFEARMSMLKLLISKGMQPLGPEDIRVTIEVHQKAVPDSAPFDGRNTNVGRNPIAYYTYEQPLSLDGPW